MGMEEKTGLFVHVIALRTQEAAVLRSRRDKLLCLVHSSELALGLCHLQRHRCSNFKNNLSGGHGDVPTLRALASDLTVYE